MNKIEFLQSVKFDSRGLVPVIAQCAETGLVLMMAYMNRDSLQQTMQIGFACYWSRSRSSLWKKGDTSGNVQHVQEIRLDCDGDCILLKVKQEGPACHTGAQSCFYEVLEDWHANN